MAVRLLSRRRTREDQLEEPAVLPSVCPQCSGPGYLEHINLVRETKTQSCKSCDHRWETVID